MPNSLAGINRQGKIHFETGFDGDKVTMKLTPPIVENSDSIVTKPVPVHLKHYVAGTAIRYTVDGTDPDSVSSPIYKNDLEVQKAFQLKLRAVKPGWYSSDVVSRYFYTSHYLPDTIVLLKPADPKYKAKEGATLYDLVKSDPGRGSGKWLGFRDNSLEALLFFRQMVQVTSVSLGMLRDVRGFIFPPENVEIWGGTDKNKLKLLSHVSPKPSVKGDPNDNFPITCEFAQANVNFIKIIAKPISKLPTWLKDELEKAKIEDAKIKKAELEKAKKEKVKEVKAIDEKSKDKRTKAEKAKAEKPWIFIDEIMVN